MFRSQNHATRDETVQTGDLVNIVAVLISSCEVSPYNRARAHTHTHTHTHTHCGNPIYCFKKKKILRLATASSKRRYRFISFVTEQDIRVCKVIFTKCLLSFVMFSARTLSMQFFALLVTTFITVN